LPYYTIRIEKCTTNQSKKTGKKSNQVE